MYLQCKYDTKLYFVAILFGNLTYINTLSTFCIFDNEYSFWCTVKLLKNQFILFLPLRESGKGKFLEMHIIAYISILLCFYCTIFIILKFMFLKLIYFFTFYLFGFYNKFAYVCLYATTISQTGTLL